MRRFSGRGEGGMNDVARYPRVILASICIPWTQDGSVIEDVFRDQVRLHLAEQRPDGREIARPILGADQVRVVRHESAVLGRTEHPAGSPEVVVDEARLRKSSDDLPEERPDLAIVQWTPGGQRDPGEESGKDVSSCSWVPPTEMGLW